MPQTLHILNVSSSTITSINTTTATVETLCLAAITRECALQDSNYLICIQCSIILIWTALSLAYDIRQLISACLNTLWYFSLSISFTEVMLASKCSGYNEVILSRVELTVGGTLWNVPFTFLFHTLNCLLLFVAMRICICWADIVKLSACKGKNAIYSS